METIEEVKKFVRDNAKITDVVKPITGGQSCGVSYQPMRLYSESLDLTIETGYHRSKMKNIELLCKLFEIAIDELIN